MKNLLKFFLLLVFGCILLVPENANAQLEGIHFQWDAEYGCLEYDEEVRKGLVPIESIGDDQCIIVCEDTEVNYSIMNFGNEAEIVSVNWQAGEGDIVSNDDEETVTIEWSEVTSDGYVEFTVILEDGTEINEVVCVEVKPKPVAKFETINSEAEIYCSQTDVYFDNLSETLDDLQIVSNYWSFGDGNYSSEQNPVHSYDEPGVYRVDLTVTDECSCSDTYSIEIKVVEPALEISCPTVTCEGATEVYTLEANPFSEIGEIECNDYKWWAEGGDIISNQDEWVEVEWNNIDEDGFGYLYFDQSACNVECRDILAIRVPVVANEGVIKGGSAELCEGEQSRYTLPQWPTTEFDWKLVNANGVEFEDATIITDQHNEIVVDSYDLPGGSYTLRADYYNTLRKCSGQAEFNIKVFENLIISEIDTDYCEGDATVFELDQNVSQAEWEMVFNGSVVSTGTGNSFSVNFNNVGTYRINVEASDYCSDDIFVRVHETPSTEKVSIDGPQEICPDQPYEYSLNGSPGNFNVEWDITNGTINGPDTGNTIEVVFDEDANPYEVSAQLVNPNFSDCVSDVITREIDRFEVDEEIISLAHNSPDPQSFCTSTLSDFIIDYEDSDTYEWEIVPEELANISDGHGTNEVEIQFNEIVNNQNQGTITVRAKVCGQMETIDSFDFSLNENPALSVNAPNEVCAEEDFSISASTSYTVNATGVNIEFTNGQSFSGQQLNPTDFEFDNISLNNVDNDQNIGYSITIQTEDCGVATYSGSIQLKPAPIVDVSIQSGGGVFCNSPITTILEANTQGSGNAFEWYYNGNLINGQTSSTLDIQLANNAGANLSFGSYYVIAENNYDCSTQSTSVVITEDCADPCNLNETVNLTGTWTDCNSIDLSAVNSGNPDDYSWGRGLGFTSNNASIDNEGETFAEITNQEPGTYNFNYKAIYDGCAVSEWISVVVEYQAEFEKSISCNGNGTYNLELYNTSPCLSSQGQPDHDYTITNLDTGAPVNLSSDTFAQSTAVLGAGNYEISLAISKPGKPVCEVTEQISLSLPDATFSLDSMFYCEEENVILSPDVINPDHTYRWEYQGAENTMPEITPNLNDGLQVDITLTVTDPYGCTDTHTISNVEVGKAVYIGSIVSQSDSQFICPGDDLELAYQNDIGDLPDSYQWVYESNMISGATSATYTTTQEGEYSLYAYDANGCIYKGLGSFNVIEAIPPSIDLNYQNKICEGGDFEITGSISPEDAEFRIFDISSGNPDLLQGWTTGPAIDFSITEPDTGIYIYEIEYRDPENNCIESEVIELEVAPTFDVEINYTVADCNPYTIELEASISGGIPGYYTWNNGMIGANITVNSGGAYRVTFHPEDGCKSRAYLEIPKDPSHYSWIFPTGCFEFCPSRLKDDPYVIGPIPEFDAYTWDFNGTPDSGVGFVEDFELPPHQGVLDLSLDNGYCEVTTDPLNISVSENCGKKCEVYLREVNLIPLGDEGFIEYAINGAIINPFPFPITLELSTTMGDLIPSHISIPAGDYIDLYNHPIHFIPNANFNGATLEIHFDVVAGLEGIICQGSATIKVLEEKPLAANVEMQAYPNPTSYDTYVNYQVLDEAEDFEGGELKLYQMNGQLLETRQVHQNQGKERFNLNHLPLGKYIVVFYHQGKRIKQHIIIKQ